MQSIITPYSDHLPNFLILFNKRFLIEFLIISHSFFFGSIIISPVHFAFVRYDEFAANELRLNDTILDLKIKLESQIHGENYGFRRQIDVLKDNVSG